MQVHSSLTSTVRGSCCIIGNLGIGNEISPHADGVPRLYRNILVNVIEDVHMMHWPSDV